MDDDEMDDMERLDRKLKRAEFRLDSFYPDFSRPSWISDEGGEAEQLMLHSGILNLENMIYQVGEK